MSLIIFITIIIIKKLLAYYGSFWLNLCDSNWVIYYCHRIIEILHVLYILENIFQLKYSGALKKILHDLLSMSPDHLTLTEQRTKQICLYTPTSIASFQSFLLFFLIFKAVTINSYALRKPDKVLDSGHLFVSRIR